MMIRTILLGVLTIGMAACEKPADTGTTTPAASQPTGDRVVIAVSGMHCGNCEQAIKQGAMTCQGVNDVTTSLSDKEVVVWVVPGTDVDAIKTKIASLGFTVDPPSGE